MTSLENTSLNARKVKDAINILVAWDLFARRQSYLYRGTYKYHIFDLCTTVEAVDARLYNLTAPEIDEFVNLHIGAIGIRFMVLGGGHPKGVNNSFEHLAYIALLRKYPILAQYGWHFEEPKNCSSYSIPCVSGIYAMLQKLAKDQQFDQFFDEFNAFCNKHKIEVSEYIVYSILVNTFTQVDTATTSEKPVELPKTVIRDCIEFYRNWQENNRQELEAERQKMSEALQQEKQRKMAEFQKLAEQQREKLAAEQEKLAAAKEAAEKQNNIEFLKTSARKHAAQQEQEKQEQEKHAAQLRKQKKTRSGKSY